MTKLTKRPTKINDNEEARIFFLMNNKNENLVLCHLVYHSF